MTALLLSAVLLLACDSGQEPPSVGGPAPQAVEPASPPEATGAAAAIQGEWTIVMTDEDRRQLEILRLAFREPPATEDELKAAGLTSEEHMMVGLMASAKANNPDDPKVVEMEQALSGLESATLSITADSMTLRAGAMSKDAAYTVKSSTGTQVTVETLDDQGRPETTTITLEGPDTLVLKDLTNAKRTQRFRRKGMEVPAE